MSSNLIEDLETDQTHGFEVYLTDGETGEEDGLVWKDILIEGESAYRPDPSGKPLKVPLRVVRGPASEGEISMSQLIEAFEDEAIEHVTIPTTHEDRPHENTGFVKALRIVDRDGKAVLRAGLNFTEDEIEGKAKRGTIANTSAGIIFNYIKKSTGKVYSQVIGHVALTNKPWLTGMKPFGVLASEDYDGNHIIPLMLDENDGNSDEFVVRFKIQDRKLKVVDTTMSEKDLKDFDSASEALSEEAPNSGAVSGDPEVGGKSMGSEKTNEEVKTPQDEIPTPEVVAFSEEDQTKLREEIKAEFSEELKAEREKNAKQAKELRELTVNDKVNKLKKLGLSVYPGFLAEVRSVYLADEGSQVLTLSEDVDGETKEVALSATGIVDRLIAALPHKDSKINFGDQALQVNESDAPSEEVSDEDTRTVEERANDLAKAVNFAEGIKVKDGDE